MGRLACTGFGQLVLLGSDLGITDMTFLCNWHHPRESLAFRVLETDGASVGDLRALPRAASSVFLSDLEVSTEHISHTEGGGTFQKWPECTRTGPRGSRVQSQG